MKVHLYYVCANVDRWHESHHAFASYQEALMFASEHNMSVVEASFSFEDSELVYEPEGREQKDAIV